ncbi:SAR2788 family putative toxin [Lederbergia galactosidilytica]|uniref:SAR2788 family putative toxin n=1 Tax=Lederbergia galactosidilytica TaxID=217031 RepID=UPI00071721EB|nr:SAR2788 family putative toxin [Lederbergia galactosidilytica]
MKKKFIKLLVAIYLFSSLVGYAPNVFAEDNTDLTFTQEDLTENPEQINLDFDHTIEEKSTNDNNVVYEVNVEEEFGINNDNFEMIVEENSKEEMTVNTEFETNDLSINSELYINIDTGQFYVTEETTSETGEVTETIYDVFLYEIEGEEFKGHLIDRSNGELYEINTIDAQASIIPVIGLVVKQGVKWAVKKYGKKALVSAFGKAALSNAIKKVAKFSVSKKHLSNAGGNYRKFNTTSQSTVRSWVKQALQKNPTISFNENYDKLSFTITANVGKKVGTKGETKIKVVFDYTGKVWTAYPVK